MAKAVKRSGGSRTKLAKKVRTPKAVRSQSKPRRRTRASRKRIPPGQEKETLTAAPAVEIVTDSGIVTPHQQPRELHDLQNLAMRWQYRLENRSRWAQLAKPTRQVDSDAKDALTQWGFAADQIREIAQSEVAEVRIPFDSSAGEKDDGWEARIFPWEFILTAATRQWRPQHALAVVRHLAQRNGCPASNRTVQTDDRRVFARRTGR